MKRKVDFLDEYKDPHHNHHLAPTLPFGADEVSPGTLLYRGVKGPSSSCTLEKDQSHIWLARKPTTARLYAKPTMCEYQVTKPLLTVGMTPGNLDFLYHDLKDQLGVNAIFNRLALAFGYDPRNKKYISCGEIPQLAKKTRLFPSEELSKSHPAEKPSGRCSLHGVDHKALDRFCSYLDKKFPWIDGYSSSSVPSSWHHGQFHEEMVLCHPDRNLLHLERSSPPSSVEVFVRYLPMVWDKDLFEKDPIQERKKATTATKITLPSFSLVVNLLEQWGEEFSGLFDNRLQAGLSPYVLRKGKRLQLTDEILPFHGETLYLLFRPTAQLDSPIQLPVGTFMSK